MFKKTITFAPQEIKVSWKVNLPLLYKLRRYGIKKIKVTNILPRQKVQIFFTSNLGSLDELKKRGNYLKIAWFTDKIRLLESNELAKRIVSHGERGIIK